MRVIASVGYDETTNSMPLSLLVDERCLSVGSVGLKSYVLISNPSWWTNLTHIRHSSRSLTVVVPHLHSINKKNSQKDQEQKKTGNYFFYDDGDDGEDDEFDDI